MKGTIYLGTIRGIKVKIHLSFFLIFILVAYEGYSSGHTLFEIIEECLLTTLLFFCVVLHEFGHAFAARTYGIGTEQIILLPIGGVAQLNQMPEKPAQELVVALAGPAVNLIIALLIFPFLYMSNQMPNLVSFITNPLVNNGSMAVQLCFYNLILLAFNLIPAFPMDGGRILRALLGFKFPLLTATKIAARIGQLIALLFVFYGIKSGNYILPFIGIFVFAGAEFELRMVRKRTMVSGLFVRDAINTNHPIAHPLENLQTVINTSGFNDVLVVDNNQIIGILTVDILHKSLNDLTLGEYAFVGTVMRSDYPSLDADESLDFAIDLMREKQVNILPVFDNNRWIGTVDLDSITDIITQRQNLENADKSAQTGIFKGS